jgi:hypothetical protein
VNPRRFRALSIAICVAAVVLRVGAISASRAWETPNAIEHAPIAANLVEGRGFSFLDFGYFGPSSVQSPTIPLLLAALFKVFGTGSTMAYATALAFNCLLGVLAALGMLHMTRELGGSRREALVAALLLAVWPTQVYAATHVQAVAFTAATIPWMIALFSRGTRTGAPVPWLAYSLVAVLASLTEPTLLPLTVLSGLMILLWSVFPWRVRIRNAAVLAGCALLVLGPWTARNWAVHGELMPVKSTFWVNVWKGANDHATGTDRLPIPEQQRRELMRSFFSLRPRTDQADHEHQYDILSELQRAELTGRSEVEREGLFEAWATAWIAENPKRYLELCMVRLYKTLWIDWDNPKSYSMVYAASRSVLLGLSLLGLVSAIRRRWRLLYPLALLASCIALHMLTLTAARFGIQLEPVQFAFAAAALVSLATLAQSRFAARAR